MGAGACATWAAAYDADAKKNGTLGPRRDLELEALGEIIEGKRLIQRHQLVYAALGDRMREEIHALSMKTLTPAEWQNA